MSIDLARPDVRGPGVGAADHAPQDVLLYDGTCALCDASVRFVRRHARAPSFRFVPLSSAEGRELLVRHGLDPDDQRSLVLVRDGRAHRRSEGALLVAGGLRWPWRALAFLRVVPRPLRDLGYDLVARHRHLWLGSADACEMPGPGIERRLP